MSIPSRHSPSARILADERTFFVSSCTAGRRQLLQSDRMAGLFINVLLRYRTQGKYQLHEFVVMRNHIHILLTLDSSLSIEKAVQFIKGGFSFRAKKELNFGMEIWQTGFSEVRILDKASYDNRAQYIKMNPVRAGYCLEPEEFPYSSASRKYELDPSPFAGAKAQTSGC
jgi:putative transposase